MQFTTNFSFEEMTDSDGHPQLVQTNRQEVLDNQQLMDNLRNHAIYILQPLRDALSSNSGHSVSITISSGYRGVALNNAVGGSVTGAHPRGQATDLVCGEYNTNQLFDFIRNNTPIFNGWMDKCIIEKVGGKEWVHIASAPHGTARCEFYTTADGHNYTLIQKGTEIV